MMQDSVCNLLCHNTIPSGGDVDSVGAGGSSNGDGAFINELILESYSMNWLIDGLPAARIRIDPQSGERFYSVGFELGTIDDNTGAPYLNNHYNIIVEYHVLPNPTQPNPPFLLSFPRFSDVW